LITKVAISAGDPNGIGPEVIVHCLRDALPDKGIFVLTGHPELFRFYAGGKGLPDSWRVADSTEGITESGVYILPPETAPVMPEPGLITSTAGAYSMHCLDKAIGLCLSGFTQAIVTAPISKEAIRMAGYNVPGHTEYLASKSGIGDVLMTMVSPVMRLGLVTGHLPVRDVAGAVTADAILRKLNILEQSLRNDFGISVPVIAVLGLNPHAGDGGVLGTEEQQIIHPAILVANEKGIKAEGPYPADAFFARKLYNNADAVLAMYHDQGLIPFKSTDLGRGVNYTAALPFVRTSPDHGTAFDIAGKNMADPSSMSAAVELAILLANNRFSPESQP
jgi:4-hydroxythreonine-4-phosphate dehydrogenase